MEAVPRIDPFGMVWAELAQAQTLLPTWVDELKEDIRTISVVCLLGNGAMTDGPLVMLPDDITTFHQEAFVFKAD